MQIIRKTISKWLERANSVVTEQDPQTLAMQTLGITLQDLHHVRMMHVLGMKTFSQRQLGLTSQEVEQVLVPSKKTTSSLRSFIAEAYRTYGSSTKTYSQQQCVEEIKSLLTGGDASKIASLAYILYKRSKGREREDDKGQPVSLDDKRLSSPRKVKMGTRRRKKNSNAV